MHVTSGSTRTNNLLSDISPLSGVLDRDELRKQFNRPPMSDSQWGAPLEMAVRLLKFHRNRRYVFEVGVRTESGWHSLIGKIHNVDRSDVFEAMEALRQAGFGPRAEFAIPQGLMYFPHMRLLLEEKINGTSAMEVFWNGSRQECMDAARRCALWLARFHAAAPRRGVPAIFAEELTQIRHWARYLARSGEPFAAKSDLIVQQLLAAASASAAAEFCANHGSYLPEHVLFEDRRTVVIDWDEYGVGDPGRDVAWFIVGLQRLAQKHFGSLHQLDDFAEVFLTSYVSSGLCGGLERLPFYWAAECLHRAKRDLAARTGGWRERAEAMLDESLRTLSRYSDRHPISSQITHELLVARSAAEVQ
jgi:aminoglycoside phosphotransferase (APT) family kinase protein